MKVINSKKTFTQILICLVLASVAFVSVNATETKETSVKIKIEKSNNQDSMVELNIDGVNEKFTLPELMVGEEKLITTQSGKEVSVSRNEKGLSINIDGKDLALPGVGANLAPHIQRTTALNNIIHDSVQISGVELDDNQKEIIKNAFKAAGVEKKIRFSKQNVMVFKTGELDLNGNEVEVTTDVTTEVIEIVEIDED
jgi:hypothetical protein